MKRAFIYISFISLLSNCKNQITENYLFTSISPSHSGIHFQNTITENDEVNVIDFQYCYNGGGVGIGDFNNDGLSDIVFTGNQVSSKLYLNQGNLAFKDVSVISNFETNTWITGVTIVDINSDGLDDIYLNVGGANCNNDCNNLLFINKGIDDNGIPSFKEKASEYGLDDGNYSQQTIFFDYDLDGDLDAYIVHNGHTRSDRNTPIPKKYLPGYLSDYLLENRVKEGTDQIYFSNVSDRLGISQKGFGLGVAINDFNNDNLPDIYVSNDFITNDLLYINKGLNDKGLHLGFAEVNQQVLSKQTYNAMGVDIADINNDILPDILVVDMLPNDYERQKKMLASNNYDKYLLSQKNGYTPQYIHNTLQIHNGFINNRVLPTSEIGFASGIASTDWSWAPLIADYDNDGNKDLYITNGYVKDITDLDFINYSEQNNIFGTPQARKEKFKLLVAQLPGIHLPNVMYQNRGKTQFDNVSHQWIKNQKSYSNGSAYADLDLDGDLDLIVNNINSPAFILENHTSEGETKYIRIKLRGSSHNKHAIGAKVIVWQNSTKQIQYQSVTKGYLSSVEPVIHFGVPSEKIDSLQVVWPDGSQVQLNDISTNQLLKIDYQKTIPKKTNRNTHFIFQKDRNIFSYAHKENHLSDYVQQSLLSHQFNALGPCITTANLNNLQGDEIFVGGSKGNPGYIFTENDQGIYRPIQKFDSLYEDTTALFFDLDNDGDKDLYIGSGGTDAGDNETLLEDRIYLNDGDGKFSILKTDALSEIRTNTSCVAIAKSSTDTSRKVFIGGGVLPGKYPLSTPSYIVTTKNGELSPNNSIALKKPGIVTDAIWADINNNTTQELIVVGQWMPITTYDVSNSEVTEIPIHWQNEQGETIEMNGWWNTVSAVDIDNDGDLDILAGNQGINGFIKPKFDKPLYIYSSDFDGNGSIDPLLAQYFKTPHGISLKPIHTRDDIMKQLVHLKKQYPTYEEFAKASFQELLNIKNLEKETFSANIFESIYAENIGNNTFTVRFLPKICQISPINDFLVEDIDQDGFKDVLIVGNNYSAEANYGRHDAMIGIYLRGSENGFIPVKNNESGFLVSKQSHHIVSLKNRDNQRLIVATQNNDSILAFRIQNKENRVLEEN